MHFSPARSLVPPHTTPSTTSRSNTSLDTLTSAKQHNTASASQKQWQFFRSFQLGSGFLLLLNNAMQVPVKDVPTKPIEGQKTGTSGLRKKTKEFMSNNYLGNWVQSLFNALGDEAKGKELGLGGDGR